MLKNIYIRAIVLLMGFLSVSSVYCQYHGNLIAVEKEIKNGEYPLAKKKLGSIKPQNLSPLNKAYYYYLLAQADHYKNIDDVAYQNFLTAKKLYLQVDSLDRAMDINLDIATLIFSNETTKSNYNKYLNDYFKYARKQNDDQKLAKGYAKLAAFKMEEGSYTESLALFKKALVLNKGNKAMQAVIHHNLSVLYNEYLNKPDSALYYLHKDLDYIKAQGTANDLCDNYINQAAAYYYLGNSKKAVSYLKAADSLPIKSYVLKTKQCIYQFLSVNYDELGDYGNAYKYLTLNNTFKDSINEQDQAIDIADIQVKYETKEKELENTVLKNKITTNRILLYTFLGLMLAAISIGWLIVKNSRRREKISLQEKLIEQQKFDKALKDYELSSIDLMLEGQEKERQRIADDLHDNLGSMLATLKLNFENLKLRKNELAHEQNKLYERTDELIEEAYQKVRRLAHSKNAGVFANEGLIPAIKKMAEKISIPGGLQLHLVSFGFTERLDNTLEIVIFRMIQELSTNIIKHSKATEATIHLTHHDDNINIIIEDNGVGFNSAAISTAHGMGLQNIQKKTEQLGGSFTIDATPGRGTTIIIDLPA